MPSTTAELLGADGLLAGELSRRAPSGVEASRRPSFFTTMGRILPPLVVVKRRWTQAFLSAG